MPRRKVDAPYYSAPEAFAKFGDHSELLSLLKQGVVTARGRDTVLREDDAGFRGEVLPIKMEKWRDWEFHHPTCSLSYDNDLAIFEIEIERSVVDKWARGTAAPRPKSQPVYDWNDIWAAIAVYIQKNGPPKNISAGRKKPETIFAEIVSQLECWKCEIEIPYLAKKLAPLISGVEPPDSERKKGPGHDRDKFWRAVIRHVIDNGAPRTAAELARTAIELKWWDDPDMKTEDLEALLEPVIRGVLGS